MISITVTQVDDPVTIGGDTSGTGAEDTAAITGTLTASDAADGLTDGTIFSVTGSASNGSASIDPATGAWSYTPASNFNGSDSFTVTVTDDDGNTETQVISITVTQVDDPVTIGGDTSGTGAEDTAAITGTLTASDTADGLTDGTIFSVTGSASNGSASIDPATGAWSYTPASNFNGSDSFTVTVTDDDGNTETQVISITVTQVDDPVTIGGDTSGTGAEDTAAITGTLTASDTADGLTDGTIFSVTGSASSGSASIDPATGAWSYTPTSNFNGSDSFTVTVTDDDGNTEIQVISITVTQVDDPVTIGGDTSGTGAEDTAAITGTLTASDAADGLTDGTIFSVTGSASNGSASIDPATGAWSYTPASNFNGSDSFTVTVTDDDGNTETQVISITVTQVDDPVTIGGDTSGTGAEDTAAITGTLTASDAADGLTDGTIFSVTGSALNGSASIDPATGAWSYTPASNFNGSDSFTVTVTDDDGNTETQVISITVTQVDDPVTIGGDTSGTGAEDTAAITGTLTASDAADGLTDGTIFSVTGSASNGSASIDPATGAWSYTPASNFNGSDSFTVTVTDDDGNTETQVISITVTQVDDPVTIGGDTSGTGAEDTAAITGTLTASDTADGLTDGTIFSVTGSASNGSVTQVDDPVNIGGDTSGTGAEDRSILQPELGATLQLRTSTDPIASPSLSPTMMATRKLR